MPNFRRYFTATQRIVIRLQIGEWEGKLHLKLHLFSTYHIVIPSELKYVNGAKVLSVRQCGTGRNTTGSVRFGFLIV